jgi:hypothetical protein
MGRNVKRFIGSTPIAPNITENQELIIPVSAMKGWINGVAKRLSGTESAHPKDADILFGTVLMLTDSQLKQLAPDDQQVRGERVFSFASRLLKQRHPFPIVRVHADIIIKFLQDEGFKRRLSANQSLWIKDRLPSLYAKLNKGDRRCSAKCPCGTSAVDTIVVSSDLAKMRNHILAHYHGTTTLNIEQLLAGAI